MKEFLKKRLPKLFIVFGYAAFYLISCLTNTDCCIFQYLFGIPCPGCGFTRAILALLRLDVVAAFRWHPMVWSFPILVLFFVCGEKINGKWFKALLLGIVGGFALVWIWRLCSVLPWTG